MARGRILFALVTRFLFFSHAFLSVGLDYMNRGDVNIWFVMLALGVPLLIETIVIIVKRKGQDYMYFWPSCFLYLSAILPVIWIMELDLLQKNLAKQAKLESKLEDLQEEASSPSIKIKGLDIKAVLDNDVPAKKIGEIGMIIIIIIGRWLLPRGQLTRDQLSTLLLGYIATGADILDIFSSIASEKIAYNVNMHYAILTAFSWSMFQFCITATVSAGSETMATPTVDIESCSEVSDSQVGSDLSTPKPNAAGARSNRSSTRIKSVKLAQCCCTCDADLLQIFVPLLMQDGPFLILRIFMWAKYEVSDELHLYFTGKNALTVVLLLYRLYCLKVKDHSQGGGTVVNEMGMENQAANETKYCKFPESDEHTDDREEMKLDDNEAGPKKEHKTGDLKDNATTDKDFTTDLENHALPTSVSEKMDHDHTLEKQKETRENNVTNKGLETEQGNTALQPNIIQEEQS